MKFSGRFALYGLFLGPVTHWWYGRLDAWLPLVTKSSVLRKVALDQTFAGPFFISAFFLGK